MHTYLKITRTIPSHLIGNEDGTFCFLERYKNGTLGDFYPKVKTDQPHEFNRTKKIPWEKHKQKQEKPHRS